MKSRAKLLLLAGLLICLETTSIGVGAEGPSLLTSAPGEVAAASQEEGEEKQESSRQADELSPEVEEEETLPTESEAEQKSQTEQAGKSEGQELPTVEEEPADQGDEGVSPTDIPLQEETRVQVEAREQDQLPMIDTLVEPYEGEVSTENTLLMARMAKPSSFDVRNSGRVGPVRNQENDGLCWAFSANGAAEISAIMQGLSLNGQLMTSQTADFSELHTGYYFYNKNDDPLHLTKGDQNHFPSNKTYRSNGGNTIMSSFAFMNWTGTEEEKDAPYSWTRTGEAFRPEQAYSSDFKMEQARFIDADDDQQKIQDIKDAVMNYGSVQIMYQSEAAYYYRDQASGTTNYCYGGGKSNITNHAVLVVGWDDHYSKDSFGLSGIGEDGAWLCRNSWGSNWGDGGYFYMSYEDISIHNPVAMKFVQGDSYDNNYSYTGSSIVRGNKTSARGNMIANVYKAAAGKGKGESLKAVSFALASTGIDYHIQVYTDLKNPANPESGKPALAEAVVGKTDFSGVYTVDLPQEVNLPKDTTFSIVIKFDQAGVLYYAEKNVSAAESPLLYNSALISPGQSFWKNDKGNWQDLASPSSSNPSCARISALTKDKEEAAISIPVETPLPEKPLGTAKVIGNGTYPGKSYLRTSWTAVDGAEGYQVQRQKAGSSAWTVAGNVKGTAYTDKSSLAEGDYYYRVRAYKTKDGKKIYGSYSNKARTRKLGKPKLTAKSAAYNKIGLSWTKTNRGQGYRIYRSASAAGSFTAQRNVTDPNLLKWTDSSRITGKTYFYKMRAFARIDGKDYYSDYTVPLGVKALPDKVTISSIKNVKGGICLTWGGLKGNVKYKVYRKKASTGKYAYVGTAKYTSYKNIFSKTKGRYYYKVRAFVTVDGQVVHGPYSVERSIAS